jgi:hypothetical protein
MAGSGTDTRSVAEPAGAEGAMTREADAPGDRAGARAGGRATLLGPTYEIKRLGVYLVLRPALRRIRPTWWRPSPSE